MAAPQSTPLPPAPQRNEPESVFIPKSNAFVAALEPLRVDLQAQADDVDTKSASATASAASALISEELAQAAGNFIGEWASLTGAVLKGVSVSHAGKYWGALVDIADITLSEPGVSADWQMISRGYGTAAEYDTGTALGQIPLNSDLGSSSKVDTGTDFDQVPLNTDIAYPVASVEGVAGLTGTQDKQQLNLKGWHGGWGAELSGPKGGGILSWDSSRAKASHNGGTVFSPTVPFSATTADYLNAVGETDGAGTGCWVRSFNQDIAEFGHTTETNEHLTIQAAIDYLSQSGGGVLTHSVDVNLTLPIYVKEGVQLKRKAGTIYANIAGASAVYIRAIYNVNRNFNSSVSGLIIENNGSTQGATEKDSAAISIYCDVENPFSNTDPDATGELRGNYAENCEISGFSTGIYLGKNTFVTRAYQHQNNNIRLCTYGYYMDDYCEYTTIAGGELSKNTYNIYDVGSSNCTAIGTQCNNADEAGIYIVGTGRNTKKFNITGNTINHNKRGIWIGNAVGTVGIQSDQVLIANNEILASSWQGIVCTGGTDSVIKDNIFSGNGEAGVNTMDDILLSGGCKRFDIDNKHKNSTGKTRYAVSYTNPAPSGADSHAYHKIDGTFEGYAEAIGYTPAGDPVALPVNANTNIIQGVFEYWNTAGLEPSEAAANANASIDLTKIPLGTICINNADNTGQEQWMAVKATSSSGAGLGVTFKRVATYV